MNSANTSPLHTRKRPVLIAAHSRLRHQQRLNVYKLCLSVEQQRLLIDVLMNGTSFVDVAVLSLRPDHVNTIPFPLATACRCSDRLLSNAVLNC